MRLPSSGGLAQVDNINLNTGSRLGSTFSYAMGTTEHNCIFQIFEQTLSVKLWAVGTAEPSGWSYERTVTTDLITDPGVLQLSLFRTSLGPCAFFIDDIVMQAL